MVGKAWDAAGGGTRFNWDNKTVVVKHRNKQTK
jgi:hypothetical protein